MFILCSTEVLKICRICNGTVFYFFFLQATEFVLEENGPRSKTKGTQYNCKPKRRSMFCQTKLSTKKKPVNTERKNMVNKGKD